MRDDRARRGQRFVDWTVGVITDLSAGLFGAFDVVVFGDTSYSDIDRLKRQIAVTRQHIEAIQSAMPDDPWTALKAPVRVERFEAFTDCPKCGRFECHWLRSPKLDPIDIGERDLGSQVEVICTCRCGHQWGQM